VHVIEPRAVLAIDIKANRALAEEGRGAFEHELAVHVAEDTLVADAHGQPVPLVGEMPAGALGQSLDFAVHYGVQAQIRPARIGGEAVVPTKQQVVLGVLHVECQPENSVRAA